MVVHTYNLGIWEAGMGGSGVRVQPELHSKTTRKKRKEKGGRERGHRTVSTEIAA